MQKAIVYWFFGCAALSLILVACQKPLAPEAIGTQNGESYEIEEYKPELKGEIKSIQIGDEEIVYVLKDGLAISGGDMILGTEEELKELAEQAKASSLGTQAHSRMYCVVFSCDHGWRWPNATINFRIGSGFSSFERDMIRDAVDHWEAETPLLFHETTSSAGTEMLFEKDTSGCSAELGFKSGESAREIYLASDCFSNPPGTVIHEIGHSIGYWHEHQRGDRDAYIGINWNNIRPAYRYAFQKEDGIEIGPYDYGSIMHYNEFIPLIDWVYDVNQPVLTPTQTVPPGVDVGQRNGLSYYDARGILERYERDMPCSSCSYSARQTSGTGNPAYVNFGGNQTVTGWLRGDDIPVKMSVQKQTSSGTWSTIASRTAGANTMASLTVSVGSGSHRWRTESTGGAGSYDHWREYD